MHAITALMLSRAIEDEQRREAERRRRRLIQAEPMRPNDRRRRTWLSWIPRLAWGSMA